MDRRKLARSIDIHHVFGGSGECQRVPIPRCWSL